MRCPNCGQSDTRVIDSRPADGGGSVRRRRVCATCEARFTTYERVEASLLVAKRGGATEPFDVSKVARGVGAALADRPVPARGVSSLIAEIEEKARDHDGPVPTEKIGHWVLEALRTIDEVAYLRFASVYKEFQGAADFEREMAALESSIEDQSERS
ncbi:MAG: transcriptional repressor NrdR [Acidimicrobiia bacterium]|nr:transcriptional repressor NrdR [Acidimicrobiia bacterium]